MKYTKFSKENLVTRRVQFDRYESHDKESRKKIFFHKELFVSQQAWGHFKHLELQRSFV